MYRLIKPLLFSLPPESAHHLAMKSLRALNRVPALTSMLAGLPGPVKEEEELFHCMGLQFSNRLGLAAGFDKDGRYLDVLPAMGFGLIELGTVTPRPQKGNPKPRLFRLPADEALINRMGFNNDGVDAMVSRLAKCSIPEHLILGANIGKNKDTPNDLAWKDYVYAFERLHPWVHYFVVNVSSPNTPGLRELQEKEPLEALLGKLQEENGKLIKPRPILLKIAPDIDRAMLKDIAGVIRKTNLQGIVLTNTTIERRGLNTSPEKLDQIGQGGLSGKPLAERSLELLRDVRNLLPPPYTVVSVGGIDSPEEAMKRIMAGADLIQIYTGMIYHGPALIRSILKAI